MCGMFSSNTLFCWNIESDSYFTVLSLPVLHNYIICWLLQVKDFSKPKEILNILDKLVNQQSLQSEDFDLAKLFETL